MELLAVKLLLAPALVAAATLVGWRFGPAIGGWLSGLPLVAGPVLLIYAIDHGERFSARAATGTLLGLVALSAFIVVYARLAGRASWMASLVAGWASFFGATAVLREIDVPVAVAATMAVGSFAAAAWITRPAQAAEPAAAAIRSRHIDLALRVAVTALLVVALSEAADLFGARVGGLLVAFPVLASVLSAFTHSHEGGAAAAGLLRGMIAGLIGFAGFCAGVALWLPELGLAGGFGAAALLALVLHAATLPLAARAV